jgi:hypothetical protein
LRYRQPVMMIAENYRFWPDRKRPGVEIKHLGTFSEARTGIGFLKLKPGATIDGGVQEDAELRFSLGGSFEYDGRTWGEGTYMFLPNGAAVKDLRSSAGATFFVITLPMLADLAAAARNPAGRHPAMAAHASA